MVGCHSASASPTGAICFDCFWEYQPVGLREDLVETYSTREYADPLIDAERHLILGRVTHDEESLCKAYVAFRDAREEDPRRRLLAAESAAFLSGDCGADPLAAFRKAADAAASAGDAFKAGVYRSVAAGTFQPRFASQEITTTSLEPPPENADGYLLGASSIHVPDGARIVMQAERTVRDWLSYQLQDDLSTDSTGSAQLLGWMEGARMQDLMQAAAVEAYPVRGVLAVQRDDAWYVADELGTFRFEVLLDKVQYASTRIYGSLALLLDTHGIAVLQRAAVLGHADLVVGCGDHPSKMQAAYRLARQGIPVWFPTDRFAGDVLGHDAGATLLGSAPVRRQGNGAIIGDTPVEFRLAEKLIVQDSDARGNARYYDSASRYFRRLAQYVALDLEFQEVDGPGQSARIVKRARDTAATAVALRIASAEDAVPLREWLRESPANRAVLFHSVAYPEGAALFRDFAGQVTFGDPRPRWISGPWGGLP